MKSLTVINWSDSPTELIKCAKSGKILSLVKIVNSAIFTGAKSRHLDKNLKNVKHAKFIIYSVFLISISLSYYALFNL